MDSAAERRRVAVAVAMWFALYLGVSAVLYGLFRYRGVPGDPGVLAELALGLGVVITGLAFVAVVIDRLVFTRRPEHFLTRQSLWVFVLVVLTVGATAAFLLTVTVSPGNAVLFGVVVALPTTMFLFAAVNLARYRTMEHGADQEDF